MTPPTFSAVPYDNQTTDSMVMQTTTAPSAKTLPGRWR
ncbi:hypothetical protein HD593_011475 [Nonomuraea rubra]|uniref:Uncharacterized protein n=1 Tax=Nonomuraea rubra TaxID=46180 RepID=A0A7X0U6P1_9ACTN|nr:hypothetical protein [Nonomuraea rubra]